MIYVGGKEANKHESRKLNLGRGSVGKTAVLAMRERGGRTVGVPIESTDAGTIKGEIFNRVELGSTLHTDQAAAYEGLDGLFYSRLDSFIAAVAGKRLTYAELIA